MYRKIKKVLVIALAIQIIVLLLWKVLNVVLPLTVMVVSVIVVYFLEGLFSSKVVSYRDRYLIDRPTIWYLTMTREERQRQRAKAKEDYMKKLKEKKR